MKRYKKLVSLSNDSGRAAARGHRAATAPAYFAAFFGYFVAAKIRPRPRADPRPRAVQPWFISLYDKVRPREK